jgi:hypothetical protein
MEMEHTGPTYGRWWRTRDGGVIQLDGAPSWEVLDERARQFGWEGHTGEWWRYWLSDIKKAVEALRTAVRGQP